MVENIQENLISYNRLSDRRRGYEGMDFKAQFTKKEELNEQKMMGIIIEKMRATHCRLSLLAAVARCYARLPTVENHDMFVLFVV